MPPSLTKRKLVDHDGARRSARDGRPFLEGQSGAAGAPLGKPALVPSGTVYGPVATASSSQVGTVLLRSARFPSGGPYHPYSP